MNRLLLAVLAALAIHVLLLLTFVPQQKIIEPEIKGSGQITVSIIQSSQVEEEPIEEPDPPIIPVQEDDPLVTDTEPTRDIEDDSAVQETQQPLSEEPVTVESVEEPKVPAVQEEESGDALIIEEIQTTQQANHSQQQVQDDNSATLSEQEVLRDPEPLQHLNRPPKYPPLARKRGWEGTVILQVDILSNGMVKDIRVKQSSSFSLLDQEAMEAVRKWHFQPGSKGGKFTDMQVLVPVHFILQEK